MTDSPDPRQGVGVVLLALACLVMPHTLAAFHAPAFPEMMLIYCVTLWTFENMAQARLPPTMLRSAALRSHQHGYSTGQALTRKCSD